MSSRRSESRKHLSNSLNAENTKKARATDKQGKNDLLIDDHDESSDQIQSDGPGWNEHTEQGPVAANLWSVKLESGVETQIQFASAFQNTQDISPNDEWTSSEADLNDLAGQSDNQGSSFSSFLSPDQAKDSAFTEIPGIPEFVIEYSDQLPSPPEHASSHTNSPVHAARAAQNEESIQFDADSNSFIVTDAATAAQINTLIADAPSGSTIYFEAGTFELDQTIIVDRDDISLSGADDGSTFFNFTFEAGNEGNSFELQGGQKEHLTEVTLGAEAGSDRIIVADPTGIEAGDVLYIRQPNDLEYLLENGWDNVSWEDADERPFREVIVRVESVSNNIVTLEDPLPYDLAAVHTDVFSIDMLTGVEISNLTITSGIQQEANYYDFINHVPEFMGTSVLRVQGADGLQLNGISILDAPSTAFDFRSTLDLEAQGLFVDGSHNLGSGGNGYGINLYETFNAIITESEVYNVRHAVTFSSWHAEVGNLVELLATNRDINFHGSPDMGNEVIVQTSILDYDPDQNTGSTRGFWSIVNEGGRSHAMTDFDLNNSVRFTHAEAYDGQDIIYGTDDGAFLSGGGSQDLIIGGDGDDLIIGGTSRDTLTGGGGSDLFLFQLGDAYDTITDFSGTLENDRIVISGLADAQSFNELRLSQSDDDAYVRFGSNSTIIIADYSIDDLTAEFFIFDSDASMLG